MKRILLFGFLAFLMSCKKPQPPTPETVIHLQVVDTDRTPLPDTQVLVGGSTGCYFCGSRQDTIFAKRLLTDQQGKLTYRAQIDPKWRVGIRPSQFPGNLIYELARCEGDPNCEVTVGRVNNITMVARKR